MTQADQDTEQRLSALEKTIADLRAEIDTYRQALTAAAAHPMFKQVMGMLGLKLPKGPPE